jgi:hypothetical protein
MKEYKIEGEPGLVKDAETKAVLSTDNIGLEAYKLRREQNRLASERLNTLEKDVSDIKHMLARILSKIEG